MSRMSSHRILWHMLRLSVKYVRCHAPASETSFTSLSACGSFVKVTSETVTNCGCVLGS